METESGNHTSSVLWMFAPSVAGSVAQDCGVACQHDDSVTLSHFDNVLSGCTTGMYTQLRCPTSYSFGTGTYMMWTPLQHVTLSTAKIVFLCTIRRRMNMLKCRTRQQKWSTWTEGAVKVYYAATHIDRPPHLHITRASIAVEHVGNTSGFAKSWGQLRMLVGSPGQRQRHLRQ